MQTAIAVELTHVGSTRSKHIRAKSSQIRIVVGERTPTPTIMAEDTRPAEAPASGSPKAMATANGTVSYVANGAPATNGDTEHHDKLVVGCDLGTTFSAIAAAYSANPDDIDIIKTWPGGNGITSDKVPTEISYDPPASRDGSTPAADAATTNTIRWGFQFRPEEPRLRCIKLFLDRNQKLPHFVSPLDTAAQLRKCDRTVMDAVSDYLGQLYKHTMETLTRRYGESFMATTKVEFVLTVPAVWSDAAKNATLQAAERAGMGNRHELKLISEPEAAAVYTLKSMQPKTLKVGDNVCTIALSMEAAAS